MTFDFELNGFPSAQPSVLRSVQILAYYDGTVLSLNQCATTGAFVLSSWLDTSSTRNLWGNFWVSTPMLDKAAKNEIDLLQLFQGADRIEVYETAIDATPLDCRDVPFSLFPDEYLPERGVFLGDILTPDTLRFINNHGEAFHN